MPQQTLELIVKAVESRANGASAELLGAFARATLRRVPDAMIIATDTDRVATALVDAFAFVADTITDDFGVRVMSADVSLDGHPGKHTVVQISATDRPFLMSTVSGELALRGLGVARKLHPIIGFALDNGTITGVVPAREAEHRQSFMHFQLESELTPEDAEALKSTLEQLLADVVATTSDFSKMRGQLAAAIESLSTTGDALIDAEESRELLRWLLDENFVLLGWREYAITGDGSDRHVQLVEGSGLGILRDGSDSRFAEPVALSTLDEETRSRILEGPAIAFSRTNRLSTVRHRMRMHFVGMKVVDKSGTVVGEKRLLGLFTRKGLAEPSRFVPVLRQKLQRVLELEDIVEGSHDQRMLVELFQAIPKDELFATSIDELRTTLSGLLAAEEQADTTVIVRSDLFTRTVSVLVSVPRDRYGRSFREAVTKLLTDIVDAQQIDVDLSLGERNDAVARFNLTVADSVTVIPDIDVEKLRADVRRLARSWIDRVEGRLIAQVGDTKAALLTSIMEASGGGYRDLTDPDLAVDDAIAIAELRASSDQLAVRVLPDEDTGTARIRAIKSGSELELSAILPVFESMGLRVIEGDPHPFENLDITVHDFGVAARVGTPDLVAAGDRIAAAVRAAWRRRIELDSLNELIVSAGMTHREVAVLRAYRRYRRQAGTRYTPTYTNQALTDNPAVARALIDLFEARFTPGDDRDTEDLEQALTTQFDAVERLDHDRILRGFHALIMATLRTNAWVTTAEYGRADGTTSPYLSFKFDSSLVPGLPSPVPYREIFVYAPDIEGVHLRGGPVARGGLRWSDRLEDVRTEVLGLMKAQVSKNSVIVPTGAKGGFVIKTSPDPDDLRSEVERLYTVFIRGLLDITDNLKGTEVIAPADVVRHDGDDPYLVVAADKGTATFSDLANSIAMDYGFWLGDAFASGGSKGYDHKALGITAKGAWVAVRQHFTELGMDIQAEDFTVAGVGDMSGDVFGNGMLLSEHIRLVAAFDHRDIFIDPDPDPATTFAERKRVFELGRSSWHDYNADLISEGGGVFSRNEKAITLTPQIKDALKIDADVLTPAELMRAILQAPVDLMWFGGIGTFIKSDTESHEDAGDRTNDDLRINATELRARVIGEGANLALTHPGRIQYARRGGHLNMDAVDNVAGVDSSDHEVNVKILLGAAMEAEEITADQRDKLLVEVTDDVVTHVLQDVRLQTQGLSLEVDRSPEHMHEYEAMMTTLEATGFLQREVEYLPSTTEVMARASKGAGLTRPELAVLVAYAKRAVKGDLATSHIANDPAVQSVLDSYFPPLLVARFNEHIATHRLRPELVATVLANDLVNRMGVTFAFDAAADSGASIPEIVAAWFAANKVAGAWARWTQIEELQGSLPASRVRALHHQVNQLVGHLTRAFGTTASASIRGVIDQTVAVREKVMPDLMTLGTEAQQRERQATATRLRDDLVGEDLAVFLACSRDLTMLPDVAAFPQSDNHSDLMDAFLTMDAALGLRELIDRLRGFTLTDMWDREQRDGLTGDLRELRTDAVRRAIDAHPDGTAREAVEAWTSARSEAIKAGTHLLRDLDADAFGLSEAGVVCRRLRRAASSRAAE